MRRRVGMNTVVQQLDNVDYMKMNTLYVCVVCGVVNRSLMWAGGAIIEEHLIRVNVKVTR